MSRASAANAMTVTELADYVGGTARGQVHRTIHACADLERATTEQVSFLSNVKYLRFLETTQAGCVILSQEHANRLERPDLTVIIAKDPYYAFRQAMVKLHGFREHPQIGVSPQAAVHPSAKIGRNVNIHPFAVIGENVVIGDDTQIYSHVTIMAQSRIGQGCILYPSVTVYDECVLGNRVILHAGAVVGYDGFGYATNGGIHHKIPQVGNVVIEDDVEVGATTVIERAALESTVIGQGSKLDCGVVIGHNCRIGPYNILVAQVAIAGSVSTGKYVVMGGQVGVAGHLHIADMSRIAGQSGVVADIEHPGLEHGGSPAMEARHARRVYMQFVQLPDMAKRLKEVESKLKKLEENNETRSH